MGLPSGLETIDQRHLFWLHKGFILKGLAISGHLKTPYVLLQDPCRLVSHVSQAQPPAPPRPQINKPSFPLARRSEMLAAQDIDQHIAEASLAWGGSGLWDIRGTQLKQPRNIFKLITQILKLDIVNVETLHEQLKVGSSPIHLHHIEWSWCKILIRKQCNLHCEKSRFPVRKPKKTEFPPQAPPESAPGSSAQSSPQTMECMS